MARCLWCFSSTLILLSWALVNFLPRNKGPPVVNYDNTVYFSHENLHAPSTKEELFQLVKSASIDVRKIRVIGSGHSWSRVAQSEDILLSLHNYAGLVSVDLQEKRVTVKAGTTLNAVNQLLEEYGLAMMNLGSISEQTVAGAISTGTHGTGRNYGNLATLVTKLEFISGQGEIITTSADENPDIFKAAQVSIGMLGVITEVTFQCVDKFNLEETLVTHSLDYCLDNLQELISSAQHVKLWIELNTNTCAAFFVNRSTDQPRGTPNIFFWNLKVVVYEAVLWIASCFPQLTQRIMYLLFSAVEIFPHHNRVDISYGIFNLPHYLPNHHEGEPVVPIEDCAEAIREVKRVVEKFEIPLNFVNEIRFVQADDIWLSPDYGRNSCHITQTIYNPSEKHRLLYFYESYEALKEFSVRVHWGKTFQMSPTDVEGVYPKFQDFARVRARMDPKGIFLNEQLDKTFGF